MKNIFILMSCTLILMGCSGTNGSDVPTQETLQKELESLMNPKLEQQKAPSADTIKQDTTQMKMQ